MRLNHQRWVAAGLAGVALGSATAVTIPIVPILLGVACWWYALDERVHVNLGRGALAGALSMGIACRWFPQTWVDLTFDNPWGPTLLLIGLQSVPTVIATTLGGLLKQRDIPWWLTAMSSWWLASMFQWIQPLPAGLSLFTAELPILCWPARIGGIALADAGLALMGVSLFQCVTGRDSTRWFALSPCLILLAIGLWWGAPQPEQTSTVALLQTGVGPLEARRPSSAPQRQARIEELVSFAVDQGAEWVIGPESAWPGAPDHPTPIPVLIGLGAVPETNRVGVLGTSQVYDKRILVPYIEPFTPGQHGTTLILDGVQIAPLICFEDLHRRLLRGLGSAEVVVTLTRDGWAGPIAAGLHLNAARLTALVTGRWVIRVASTGPTAVIAPDGSVDVQTAWTEGDGPGNTQLLVHSVGRIQPAITGADLEWFWGLMLCAALFRYRTPKS